jgi:hypothetical protein
MNLPSGRSFSHGSVFEAGQTAAVKTAKPGKRTGLQTKEMTTAPTFAWQVLDIDVGV